MCEDKIKIIHYSIIISLAFGSFVPIKVVAEKPEPVFDGSMNTIASEVIYKINPPTSEEEVELVRKYDEKLKADQKRIAEEQRKIEAQRKRSSQIAQTSQTKSNGQAQVGYSACNCVSYARWRSGINTGPIRLAKFHPINHSTPVVGAIGVMKYNASAAGHLFVVAAIQEDGMWIDDANWTSCKVTHRFVPLSYGEGFYY